jgi:cell division transport system ATP-binding protein
MALDTLILFENATISQLDHQVLTNVNFSVNKGEFVYLIGKVGSGKSSLIKTINAELPLKDGEAMVLGYDLKTIRRKQVPFLRRKMGIVFQDFQLLTDRNVYDNLQFVLKATGWKNKSEIDERINDVLERVGLSFKGYKMPHQLSGGEQQRVVIARALLNNPEIILADEPTGNLDPETSEEIIKILLDIRNNGRTVIMATHNYSLLKKFPARTIKCEKDKLVEINQSQEIELSDLME